jgi:CRP-like cAMP-binding protein
MIDKLLTKLRRFDTVSAEEERVLREAVWKTVSFKRGQTIVRSKTELHYSALLLEGFVNRSKSLTSGGRLVLQLAVPGDFIDLHSFVLKELDHDIDAVSDCRLALFKHEQLREAVEQHPHLARLLWLSTIVDAGIHREWMLSLGRRSAKSRLAHLFCELQVRLTAAGMAPHGKYDLPLNQAELADVLGLTAVHTNRVLKELREEGLLTFKSKIVEVRDWDGLVALAEFDPFYLSMNQRPR